MRTAQVQTERGDGGGDHRRKPDECFQKVYLPPVLIFHLCFTHDSELLILQIPSRFQHIPGPYILSLATDAKIVIAHILLLASVNAVPWSLLEG